MDLLGEARSRDSPALFSSPRNTLCSAAVVEFRMYHASLLPLAHGDVLGCPLCRSIISQHYCFFVCLFTFLPFTQGSVSGCCSDSCSLRHAERVSGECHLARLFICSCLLLIYTNLFEKRDDCCLKNDPLHHLLQVTVVQITEHLKQGPVWCKRGREAGGALLQGFPSAAVCGS